MSTTDALAVDGPRPLLACQIDRLPHEEGRWPVRGAFSISWSARTRVENGVARTGPAHPATPGFENGTDLDLARDAASWCTASCPPWPGKLGMLHLRCQHCDVTVDLTTAGRADDPKLVRLPCWWGRAKG
jgi:hypothetical protein